MVRSISGDCYQYVRQYYEVPAYIGVRVTVRGKSGVLARTQQGHYVYILFDGEKRATGPFHPTDGIEYQP